MLGQRVAGTQVLEVGGAWMYVRSGSGWIRKAPKRGAQLD
jgi:hypothetical protein